MSEVLKKINITDKPKLLIIIKTVFFIACLSVLITYSVFLSELQCHPQSSSQNPSGSLFRNSIFRPLRTLTNTVNYNIIYGGNGMMSVGGEGGVTAYLKGPALWSSMQRPITNSSINSYIEDGIFVVSADGMYIVSAQLDFSVSYNQFGFCVNGNAIFNGTNYSGDIPCNTGTLRSSITTLLKLNNGDKVGLITYRYVSPERVNTKSDTTWNCAMIVAAPGSYGSYFSICKIG